MDDYDVVVDVLTKHAQKLWKMTERNMRSEYIGMNIMDDIRLKQIETIDEAIRVWKNYNAEEHPPYYVVDVGEKPTKDELEDIKNDQSRTD